MQIQDDEEEIGANCQGPEQGFSGRFRDDLTGQVLKDELVLQEKSLEESSGGRNTKANRPASNIGTLGGHEQR